MVVAALLFVACGGGGGSTGVSDRVNQPQISPDGDRGTLSLVLSSETAADGNRRILLHGRNARDLYQIAASLRFDPVLYDIVLVEAGGGLGDPEQSYFLDSQSEPGKLDFAYTRRWYGDGVNGDPLLLSVKVRPLAAFNLSDFRIDNNTESIRVRDSRKHVLPCLVDGQEVGNE